jgi:glycerol-3-phosphate dehydrogenase
MNTILNNMNGTNNRKLDVKFQEIVHAAGIWEDGVVETTNNPIPADEHSF